MEMTPRVKAYFEAKDGDFDAIDDYFTDDVQIEDAG
jgi:hypothetical protein